MHMDILGFSSEKKSPNEKFTVYISFFKKMQTPLRYRLEQKIFGSQNMQIICMKNEPILNQELYP